MDRRTRPSRTQEFARWLLLAVALLIGLARPGEAASRISPARASSTDGHAQFCGCRHCKGASCCCGHRRAKAPAARPGDGPCVNGVPCGDAGLPDTPIPGPSGKVASLASRGDCPPDTAGRLLPPDARCVPPVRRPSHLDEPPERLVLA